MSNIKINSFGEGSRTAEYQPYDPALPEVFAGIKSLLTNAIPDILVEHIGSSSIPGVGGRNVVDIAIPSRVEKHAATRATLQQLGFEDSPFPHYLPLLVASVLLNEKKYFILLYIISPEDKTYKDWINFRNYMRTHPEDANEYNEIKKQATKEGHTEGDSYQNAKTPFLQKMNSKIQAV